MPTIQRMERAEGVPQALGKNLEAIQGTLETAGVEFIGADNGGAGVRMRVADGLDWTVDFENKSAECEMAHVSFYEFRDGGYGVSFVRLLSDGGDYSELDVGRSAQRAIDEAAKLLPEPRE